MINAIHQLVEIKKQINFIESYHRSNDVIFSHGSDIISPNYFIRENCYNGGTGAQTCKDNLKSGSVQVMVNEHYHEAHVRDRQGKYEVYLNPLHTR